MATNTRDFAQEKSVLLAFINIRQPLPEDNLGQDEPSTAGSKRIRQMLDALKKEGLVLNLPDGRLVVTYRGLQYLGKRSSIIRDIRRMYNLVESTQRRGGNSS